MTWASIASVVAADTARHESFFDQFGFELAVALVVTLVVGTITWFAREAIKPRLQGVRAWFVFHRDGPQIYDELTKSINYTTHLRDVMQAFWRARAVPPGAVDERIRRDILEPIRTFVPTAPGETIKIVWFRPNEEGSQLQMHQQLGHTDEGQTAMRLPVGGGIAGRVFTDGETITVPDISKDERFRPMPHGVTSGSLLCAPVVRGHEVTGVLSVLSNRQNAFWWTEERYIEALATAIGAMETLSAEGVEPGAPGGAEG